MAFVCEHVNKRDFYTEIWGVDVFENYALEQLEQQPKSLLSGILGNNSKEVSIHSSYLNIGLTDSIKLIDEGHLDTEQTAYLLNKLKEKLITEILIKFLVSKRFRIRDFMLNAELN